MKKINVGLVGMGFGCCFIPIYLKHPNVESLTICDANPERMNMPLTGTGGFDVRKRVPKIEDLLNDPVIDAIHLTSGITDHAKQTIAVLRAGKHCACTVPMATSLEDIRAIIAAVRETGKRYMMMETQFYSREFLHACELRDKGVFGHLQFLRGSHYQDMENWPPYWAGLPPMWYATHAISPLLAFAQTRAKSVHCFGSGYMREELKSKYGNPYPVETAIFDLEREVPLAMEVTRTLFHSARGYHEGFNFYGEDAMLEWPFHDEPLVLFRQTKLGEVPNGPRLQTYERIGSPDYGHLLPKEIADLTGGVPDDGRGNHPSVKHGGHHGGSHPHMVHEFIRTVVENRKSTCDEVTAANWTAAGICAHESAMKHGAKVEIPTF